MALMDFADRTGAYRERIDLALEQWLPPAATHPQRFHTAMRYAVFGASERARALLTYAAAEWLGLPPERVDAIAVAVELVHAYAVVHSELPAMSDENLREGRATTHRAFDEATAILVGDALQAHAYHVLAADARLMATADIRRRLIVDLARAGGSEGIAGGQALGRAAGAASTPEAAEDIHFRKAGRLFQAAVLMPCRMQPDLGAGALDAADRYGRAIGLAWALPAVPGEESARRRLDALRAEALAALTAFGPEADGLRWSCGWAVSRGR
jgi:farnesyl diphosphate synthase